jgi:SAM-dependent methyltransferase
VKITKLPDYIRSLRRDIDELFDLLRSQNHEVVSLKQKEADDFRQAHKELEDMRARNAELEHMVHTLKLSAKAAKAGKRAAPDKELFADNHDLDTFYLEFENRFRGTEAEIQKKQEPYVKLFEKSGLGKKYPIVDLGCGRGEFLDLLNKKNLQAVGVDLNESMVERAKAKGFAAVNDEGIHYLMQQKSNSLAGVTGFHLAEHIPFESLLVLMAEAQRCLVKGGILLLETPNPESLFVGAFTFHYDPSHLKPLPPAIVQFSALFKGFEKAEIMRMQPELTEKQIKEATKNPTLQGALQRLYGPRDYALVAYK